MVTPPPACPPKVGPIGPKAGGGVTPVVAYVALGSNQGTRLSHLKSGRTLLQGCPRIRVVSVSSVYQSSPLGGVRQRNFLNAVVKIRTGFSPFGLLFFLKWIETRCGRKPGKRWGPRPLDLDLIFYGRTGISHPFLRVPHPLFRDRLFVLEPFKEVLDKASSRAEPGLNRRIAFLKAQGQNVTLYRSRW